MTNMTNMTSMANNFYLLDIIPFLSLMGSSHISLSDRVSVLKQLQDRLGLFKSDKTNSRPDLFSHGTFTITRLDDMYGIGTTRHFIWMDFACRCDLFHPHYPSLDYLAEYTNSKKVCVLEVEFKGVMVHREFTFTYEEHKPS
jgi:hypothetical protein